MDTKLFRKMLRLYVVFVLLLLCASSWWFAYTYYQKHQAAIWLQVEELVETVTLPLRLAKLSTQGPAATLPVPVHSVRLVEIADTWGGARGDNRTHEGVDIFAPTGTPVYAATNGFVVHVGENTLGGNIVFTVGPGGVRYYYAHLSRVASGIDFGTEVTTDTVIGFVGNSGNAVGTSPHLHFGVYQRGAKNPYPLLVERS